VYEAAELVRHRGPDEASFLYTGDFVVGHRRLKVFGRDGGRQPLLNSDGSVAAVYNGEIYNHVALWDGAGPCTTDGQVIPQLIEGQGPAALGRLHGMFALAAQAGERLILARDRVGIKPLYWTGASPDTVFFASEFKALLGLCPPESIEEFPPGQLYDSAKGLSTLPAAQPHRLEPTQLSGWVERLAASLEESVRIRLMADGPVGVFLSGGLDSSLIAAIASKLAGPVHTFAVGLPGSEDLEAAAVVAAHLRSRHHEVYLDATQVQRDLPDIVYHLESFDPDLVRSAVPCYYVSLLASQHVKTVLTGEGADELFAGYRYLRTYARCPRALGTELSRLQSELPRMNLQRVDRMSMAHGLEARVPFLDTDLIGLARQIPPELLLTDTADKLVLRLVADRYLPAAVAWRPKLQFDEGSGICGLPASMLSLRRLRKLFRTRYPAELERLVARWRHGRLPGPRVRRSASTPVVSATAPGDPG